MASLQNTRSVQICSETSHYLNFTGINWNQIPVTWPAVNQGALANGTRKPTTKYLYPQLSYRGHENPGVHQRFSESSTNSLKVSWIKAFNLRHEHKAQWLKGVNVGNLKVIGNEKICMYQHSSGVGRLLRCFAHLLKNILSHWKDTNTNASF